jgi:hypothetical protein
VRAKDETIGELLGLTGCPYCGRPEWAWSPR